MAAPFYASCVDDGDDGVSKHVPEESLRKSDNPSGYNLFVSGLPSSGLPADRRNYFRSPCDPRLLPIAMHNHIGIACRLSAIAIRASRDTLPEQSVITGVIAPGGISGSVRYI